MRGVERRRNIHARVSEDSYAGWASLCDKEGVTMSGLMEAIGLFWLEHREEPVSDVQGKGIMAIAHQIDRDRRRRRI